MKEINIVNPVDFGKTKEGEQVLKYILKNDQLEVSILNYGGIITEIIAKDRDGKKGNVVLGYDNIKDYEENSPYFGCITGRNAGRITQGRFSLNGVQYQLERNNGENHLHGGVTGLDKRVWKGILLENRLTLTYISPDGEEGYPGEIKFRVDYILNGNQLEIEYHGEADRDTIINLTNHTYFNLSGDIESGIYEHKLFIDSDQIAELDNSSALTGKFIEVENTPFDFRKSKTIGSEIESSHEQIKIGNGYDHPFILNKVKKIEMIVKEPSTGRELEIETDQKVVIFYTGNYLKEGVKLSSGKMAKFRCGFCLETQDLPNYINVESWEKKIYNKENPYSAKTIYRFKN